MTRAGPYCPVLTPALPRRSVQGCAVRMDRDFSRSRAILISNAVFSDGGIPNLPGAVGCTPAMEALLTSDLCGWPSDRVETLQDMAAPPELARKLVELTEGVQDVLLLYYVGHGMRIPNGQLALALRDTSANRALLRHTAMVYKDVADILRGCPATTKLVILDCCHAELGNRASDQFQSADIDAEPVDGLYCIWASKEWEKARSPLSGGLTYFTGKFVDVVRTGIPGKPPDLTIDQIFTELRARLLRANLPEPAQSGIRDANHWRFARNAAPPETHRDPDREIAHLLQQMAAAEERERVLQATVTERTAEVERLRQQMEESESRSAAQRQQLDAELQAARARLGAATTAQAAAQAEFRQAADSVRTRRQLARMQRAGYFTIDALPIPNSREVIDHLVIGPTGVYAIDSEKWDPQLPVRTWNGKKLYHGPDSKHDWLNEAAWKARQASEILSAALGTEIQVRPAMAIYGAKIPWGIATIMDVDVLSGATLGKYLRRRSLILEMPQVRLIYDTAVRMFPVGPPQADDSALKGTPPSPTRINLLRPYLSQSFYGWLRRECALAR